MKKEKDEKIFLEGKEVKIKTIYQPQGAWAGNDGKTVILNEKTKNTLKKNELNSILLHERGHLTLINKIFTFLPPAIIIVLLVRLFNKYGLILFLVNFPIIFTLGYTIIFLGILIIIGTIIELPFMWAREIHSDWYAVKRTKGNLFRRTYKKFYHYNKKVIRKSPSTFYNRVVLHPPMPLRLKIIKYMEKVRDKKC